MNRLTVEERRRIYLAQQRAHQTILARPRSETVKALATRSDQETLKRIAMAAMIAALLGGGLLALPMLEFHPLDSLVGTLLPRL